MSTSEDVLVQEQAWLQHLTRGGRPDHVFQEVVENDERFAHLSKVRLLPFILKNRPIEESIVPALEVLEEGEVGCFLLRMEEGTIYETEEVATGRCSTDKTPHKGARKWKTAYVVYRTSDDVELSQHDLQADAISAAREYSIDNLTDTYIKLEKRLEGSDPVIIKLSPITKTIQHAKKIPNNSYCFFAKNPNREM